MGVLHEHPSALVPLASGSANNTSSVEMLQGPSNTTSRTLGFYKRNYYYGLGQLVLV